MTSQSLGRLHVLGLILILIACVLAVFWPSLSSTARWFDDGQYLSNNRLVQNPSWDSVRRFVVEITEPSTVRGYYQPLTMMSLMFDYAITGTADDLRVYRFSNLVLHIVNTALVFLIVQRLFGKPYIALLIALIFGLHPTSIESVVPIAQRKTVLSTAFAFASLLSYVTYAQSGRKRFYVTAFAAAILAFLSKPTTIALPLLFVILDIWPLRRVSKRTLMEKIPLLAAAAAFAILTLVSQEQAAEIRVIEGRSLPLKLAVSCYQIFFYLISVLLPVNVARFYPFPNQLQISDWRLIASFAGAALLVVVVIASLRRTRALAATLGFFVLAIAPTLGVIAFTFSMAADRFLYFPVLGILLLIAAGWMFVTNDTRANRVAAAMRKPLIAASIGGRLCLALLTRHDLAIGRTTETLDQYNLRLAPESPHLNKKFANTLYLAGRFEDAIEQ